MAPFPMLYRPEKLSPTRLHCLEPLQHCLPASPHVPAHPGELGSQGSPACLPASVSFATSCRSWVAAGAVTSAQLSLWVSFMGKTWAGGDTKHLHAALAQPPRASPHSSQVGSPSSSHDLPTQCLFPLLFQVPRAPAGQHETLPQPRCSIPTPDAGALAALTLTGSTG